MKCKFSGNKIVPFMSFGKMPLANGFLKKEDFSKEFFYELEVGFDKKYNLFQINEHPKPEKMFNENYPFYTGLSKYMINHFKDLSNNIKKKFLKNTPRIIEIGSNDGTMLSNFINSKHIGFEPSKSVHLSALKKKINSVNKFFNRMSFIEYKEFHKATDLIYAANVICHIPDLKELIETVDLALSSDGIFIFEEPYLLSMINKTSYDQIYDEHIYIFSLSSIKNIFDDFGFELFFCEEIPTHGGSMRYYVARKGKKEITKELIYKLDNEKKNNIDNEECCNLFKQNCTISKKKLNDKIKNLTENGEKICGYGATSKSTTILNFCDIGPDKIEFICDTTPDKIGKYSPGKHIPIVDNDHFQKNFKKFPFLLAWNHEAEIIKKETRYADKGGIFFTHLI